MAQTEFNDKVDEEGIARCKCVVEFRVSRSKFMDISMVINIKVKDIEMEKKKISMFAYVQTLKTRQRPHLRPEHDFG